MSEHEIERLLAQEQQNKLLLEDVVLEMKLGAQGWRTIRNFKGRIIAIAPAPPPGKLELQEISIDETSELP